MRWKAIPDGAFRELSPESLRSHVRVFGQFSASYALALDAKLLNGAVSVRANVSDWASSGSVGLVWRATDTWSFNTVYIYSFDPAGSAVNLVAASFAEGFWQRLYISKESIQVQQNEVALDLNFRSGDFDCRCRSGINEIALTGLITTNPFPGHVGVLRYYNCDVEFFDFRVSRIQRSARAFVAKSWDAFISYSSADRAQIKLLVKGLRDAGLAVWFDDEQILAGDSIVGKIGEGLQRSKVLLACIGTSYATSGWCRAEYESILATEFARATGFVIPVLMSNSLLDDEKPILLRGKRAVSFASPEAVSMVVQAIRSRA